LILVGNNNHGNATKNRGMSTTEAAFGGKELGGICMIFILY
jgi:hypothetical protein